MAHQSVTQSASQSIRSWLDRWSEDALVAARAGPPRRPLVSRSDLRVMGSPRPARNLLLVFHCVPLFHLR